MLPARSRLFQKVDFVDHLLQSQSRLFAQKADFGTVCSDSARLPQFSAEDDFPSQSLLLAEVSGVYPQQAEGQGVAHRPEPLSTKVRVAESSRLCATRQYGVSPDRRKRSPWDGSPGSPVPLDLGPGNGKAGRAV